MNDCRWIMDFIVLSRKKFRKALLSLKRVELGFAIFLIDAGSKRGIEYISYLPTLKTVRLNRKRKINGLSDYT